LGHRYIGQFRLNRIYGKGHVEFKGFHHSPDMMLTYAKDDWAPCLLGEAVAEARLHWKGVNLEEEMKWRQLLRVRDDMRALDLQLQYRRQEQARLVAEEQARKEARKKANRAKREAELKAKEAVMSA
jgi:hypothetical protein